jgi:RNA polymerase sigma factor for flagellar operon FliA
MSVGEAAPQRLIEEGQALVRSLALKIARTCGVRIDLEDLIAYGQIGLAEAAHDYRSGRGSQFTSYAYYRIRGAIYDGISKMSWTSRARYRRLRYEQLAHETLREVNEAAGSADDGTLESDTKWFRGVTERLAVVYFSAQDEAGLADVQLEDPAATPPVEVASREIGRMLRDLVAALPAEEQRLVRAIYFEGATLQAAAEGLGISKSWASRLHAKTLSQLATLLRRVGVDGSP